MIGVYYIENFITNKVYIGSSIDIPHRWSVHLSELKRNKHANKYLQHAWNKYGETNFQFGIIECISDKTKLIEREQYWIDKTFSNVSDFGYNLRENARNNLGMIVSEETRIKLRIASLKNGNKPPSPLGKKHSQKAIENMKIAKKGRIVTEYQRKNYIKARLDYLDKIWALTEPPIEWRH